MRLEKNKKETIFTIVEALGSSNIKPIEKWSLIEIMDYLDYKKKQINKIKSVKNE